MADELPAGAPPICMECNALLLDTYFMAQGRILCGPCGQAIRSKGSKLEAGRFLRGLGFGLVGAAIASVVLWFVTAYLFYTPWVSLLAGIVVGKAVQKGTRKQGGRPFQILALTLTYLCVVGMYARLWGIWSAGGIWTALTLPLRVVLEGGGFGFWAAATLGLSLFVAWKMNRGVPIEVQGPLQLGPTLPPDGLGGI